MVGWWNPADVKEETPLFYDDFDPLKEWLVDPDPVQLQNPCEFSNISLESHGLHYNGVKLEQEDQILESSIDVKMQKVSLLEISDRVQGEVVLNENGGGNEEEINFVTPALETQKIASPLPSDEGTCEGQIGNEVESMSVAAESDSGDSSSSNDSSSDESTSIAESISSSEDEDDVGMKRRDNVAGELEEGEVRELDAHEIDFLSEEEEGPKGPIRSKHEVEDLPPVPKIDVPLQPHHRMLPVGVILSVMMNRVIVEGSVRHNPLNEGSVLWVTDTRSQLGLVDEIFGPVKNPFYVVRYNNEQEVPAEVGVGISVSFVAEFASQILNNKDLYRKGYDASGDNDEELDNDFDFSDDEKEAEFRRSLRQENKRTNDWREEKRETTVDWKRNTSKKPTIQHKDIPKQLTCTPLSMNRPQPAAFVGQSSIVRGDSNLSTNTSGVRSQVMQAGKNSNLSTNTSGACPQAIQAGNFFGNSSQQNPNLLALSGAQPSLHAPQAMQAGNIFGNTSQQLNPNLLALSGAQPSLHAPQAMQAGNILGNTSQQLNPNLLAHSGTQPSLHAPQAMEAGNFLGNTSQQLNPDLLALPGTQPSLHAPQAMQAGNFFGNSSQQLNPNILAHSGTQPSLHAPQATQPGNFLGNSSQQLNPNLLALSGTRPSLHTPQAMQAGNFLGNSSQQSNPDLLALSGTQPSLHASQAMQAGNFLGNSSQPLNPNLLALSGTQPSLHASQAMQSGNFLGNSSQQLNPNLLSHSGARPSLHAPQAGNFLSNSSQQLNADLAAPRRPEFLQAMQAVNFVGNSPQQLPSPQQSAPWQPAFSPLVPNTGFQGDLPMQLQNQNLLLNNLVSLMALQQQLQQFIPQQGSTLPWPGAASSMPPSGQNNFAPTPFGNGFMTAPGQPQPRPGNEQTQGQTPSHFAPYMQFNAGNSNSSGFNGGDSRSHGRRPPFQRGGGGRFVGRGGRQPNM